MRNTAISNQLRHRKIVQLFLRRFEREKLIIWIFPQFYFPPWSHKNIKDLPYMYMYIGQGRETKMTCLLRGVTLSVILAFGETLSKYVIQNCVYLHNS